MRILTLTLAEDDPRDADLTVRAIMDARPGTDLAVVHDGEELLRWLDDNPAPDLVLLDLAMPHMDGLTALAQIRATPGLKALPVIVFTGSNHPAQVSRAYDLAVMGYFYKPIGIEDYNKVVGAIVNYCEIVELPKL